MHQQFPSVDLSLSVPINDSFSSVTGPLSVMRPRGGPKRWLQLPTSSSLTTFNPLQQSTSPLDRDFPAVWQPSGTKSRPALLTRALKRTKRGQTAAPSWKTTLPATAWIYWLNHCFLPNVHGCLCWQLIKLSLHRSTNYSWNVSWFIVSYIKTHTEIAIDIWLILFLTHQFKVINLFIDFLSSPL